MKKIIDGMVMMIVKTLKRMMMTPKGGNNDNGKSGREL